MASSVYISKNLNQEQLHFMRLLDDFEIDYFKMQEIEQQIQHEFQNLNEVLENLVHKKLLTRIEKGIYCRQNFHNIQALATFIGNKNAIAYWSALHHHGLTDRFPNTLFVKTIQRKRDTQLLGTPVQFISVKAQKYAGTKQTGYGNNAFTVTDVEMTIVDCFDQLRYAGDFDDLISAFAKAKLTNQKLIAYTKRYNNITLTKRLGYLASLFHPEKLNAFIEYAKKQVNKRYNLIYPGGNEHGVFNSQWKLRLNVSEKDLIQMSERIY